ncbi:MAG TPA: hypothetical protein VMB73_15715 [Acetobacteraceae bacterium]|nr:hypothetical protein [Acetobacteraceae bacterium]
MADVLARLREGGPGWQSRNIHLPCWKITTLTDRQAPTSYSVPIGDQYAVPNLFLTENPQRLGEPGYDFGITPVAVTAKDQARFRRLRKSKQSGVVEIRRDDCSAIMFGTDDDVRVRCALTSQVVRMDSIVPLGW